MNVSDLLNPLPSNSNNNNNKFVRARCVSTPVIPSSSSSSSSSSPTNTRHYYEHNQHLDLHHLHQQHLQHQNLIGKPRSRFSEYEDNVIRQGVAQRLTWGQISDLLPHRKRATCFNRYRTLQGIRKSRKLSEENSPEMSSSSSLSPTSPVTSCFSDPTTPPTSTYTLTANSQPNWFTSSSADIIYDHQQHLPLPKYPTSYVNDINSSSGNSSDSSSDDNDDFPFTAQTMTKRSHKISLPALTSYHHPHHPHYRSISSSSTTTTTTTSNAIQPYYSL